MVTFDAELRLLRHQKLKLDTQMKLSDLHHVTLFQEILLLKNFEKQENILQERVNSLDKEEQDMQVTVAEKPSWFSRLLQTGPDPFLLFSSWFLFFASLISCLLSFLYSRYFFFHSFLILFFSFFLSYKSDLSETFIHNLFLLLFT